MNDFDHGRRKTSNDHGNLRDEQEETENRGRNRDTRAETLKRMDSIQDPGKRYALKDCIGTGVCGDVYEGIDQQAGTLRKIYVDLILNTGPQKNIVTCSSK